MANRSLTVGLNLLAKLMAGPVSADTIDEILDLMQSDPMRVEKGEKMLEPMARGTTDEELLAVARNPLEN